MKTLKQYETLAKNNCSIYGDCLECAIHDYYSHELRVHSKTEPDEIILIDGKKRKVEIKSNGGSFKKNIVGCSYVLYVPAVDLDATLNQQEGFIIKKTTFIKVLKQADCYRANKKTTQGTTTEACQSVWNNKKRQPHGAKLFKLLDLLYDNCEATFDEFFK